MDDDFDPVELERVRRFGRPDWRRFVRPDWERFVHPAGHDAMRKQFALWDRAFETPGERRLRLQREEREREEQARLEAEQQEEIEREVLAMKAELASLRSELIAAELDWKAECAERKRSADIAWDRFIAAFKRGDFAAHAKANFNPDQERVPAGSGIESGRWTRVAGKLPPTLGHNSGNFDIPPDRPEDSRERTGAIRAAARFLAKIPGPIGRAAALVTIFEGASWLREHQAEIETQLDPPKTFRELQDAVAIPRAGTQKHHVVEQSAEESSGFERSRINSPDNLVRTPKQQHEKISNWYSTKNEDFGWLTPREWLRGKSWEEHRALGIKKLIEVGVLKP